MPRSSRPAASWFLEKPGRREDVTARTSTRSLTPAPSSSSSTAFDGVCSYPMVKSFFALAIVQTSRRVVFQERLLHALDQLHRTSRRADLALVNDIGEHVARGFLRLGLVNAWQVVGFAAPGPELQALGPCIELLRRIAGLEIVIALLQSRIDEISRDIRDRRVGAVLGKHHGRLEFTQQRNKGRSAETVVPYLDDVTQLAAVDLARQQLQEFTEIGFVEFLGRRELPEHRAEPVAELEHAGVVEIFDGVAGFGEHAPVGGEARSLQREHKTIRHLACPFAEALGFLRAVIGAVDFDRGQLRGRVLQLLRLRELFRVEHPTPWREGPAADADKDVS